MYCKFESNSVSGVVVASKKLLFEEVAPGFTSSLSICWCASRLPSSPSDTILCLRKYYQSCYIYPQLHFLSCQTLHRIRSCEKISKDHRLYWILGSIRM